MFQKSWDVNEIPDLSGRAVIITGANSGLGYETARQLVKNRAHCVLACRDIDKAEKAVRKLKNEFPFATVESIQIDLADLETIRFFAESFTKKYDRLDLLVNNAGVMMTPKQSTIDGFEQQLGVNHFGHFALTGLLLPLLSTTPNSRVITVSSIAHKSARIDFDDLFFENGEYHPQVAYRRSKLANLLFAQELKEYFRRNEIDTKSISAHPGVTLTNIGNHLFAGRLQLKLLRPLIGAVLHSPSAGALSILRAAIDLSLVSGDFIGPKKCKEWRGSPEHVEMSSAVIESDAKQLWKISEKLTGVYYP